MADRPQAAVVPTLDEEEIRDLFFSRVTIERAAVSSLAATGEVPAAAAKAQVAIEYAARDGLFENQVEADIAFHSALVSGVGSRRLSRMHELIIGEVHLTMGQYQAHRTANPTTSRRNTPRSSRQSRTATRRRPPNTSRTTWSKPRAAYSAPFTRTDLGASRVFHAAFGMLAAVLIVGLWQVVRPLAACRAC